ncbi:MAG: hypothetical protein NHB15_19850 [Methanosarcina barkeri]|nr:hypothetical protein [Methanosarcina sp. ERenArc_MAG2]
MKYSIICDEKQFKEFMDSIQPPISKEEYDIQYKSFLRLSKKKLPYIYDLNHLSFLIGESTEQLDFFVRNKRKIYVSYKMKKKGADTEQSTPHRKNLNLFNGGF